MFLRWKDTWKCRQEKRKSRLVQRVACLMFDAPPVIRVCTGFIPRGAVVKVVKAPFHSEATNADQFPPLPPSFGISNEFQEKLDRCNARRARNAHRAVLHVAPGAMHFRSSRAPRNRKERENRFYRPGIDLESNFSHAFSSRIRPPRRCMDTTAPIPLHERPRTHSFETTDALL